MSWPVASEFVKALQNPATAFQDPRLQRCTVEINRTGRPRVWSGAFACVFKVLVDTRPLALRVFTSDQAEREYRYRAVTEHILLQGRPNSLVGFTYDAAGIRVNGRRYPIQSMDWVKGDTLDVWVQQRVKERNTVRLRRLADQWVRLVEDLQSHRIAHGDLQHGNVIVDGDTPVLVDYDAMCVPSLVGRRVPDLGHAAYQHPGRDSLATMTLAADDFSAWVILIALRALASDPTLWAKYVDARNGEALLFSPRDIIEPHSSSLWTDLARSADADVRAWADALRRSLDLPVDRVPRFDVTAATRKPLVSQGARPLPPVPTYPRVPPSVGGPPPGPMVFVSHSTADREIVERAIVDCLEGHGIKTWYSKESIHTAAKWEKTIRDGLKSCKWFLVAISPRAVNSEWVQAEVHWAMQRRQGCIIPVLIEACDPADLHLMLDQLQHVDFRGDWAEGQRRLLAVWGITPQRA
jgi:hypothetical protein